jgi:hypothetical protein
MLAYRNEEDTYEAALGVQLNSFFEAQINLAKEARRRTDACDSYTQYFERDWF